MDILDDLFKFPIVEADGNIEQRKLSKKERFGNMPDDDGEEEEMDIAYGEAECPCRFFIGLYDRWLPSDESFRKAQEGIFEACHVTFSTIGSFLVPWTKEKFKKEYKKFVNDYNKKIEEERKQLFSEKMEERPKEEQKEVYPVAFLTSEQIDKLKLKPEDGTGQE